MANTPVNNFIQSLCRVRDNCPRYLFINGQTKNVDSRGIGIHHRDKIENLSKSNDALRKILESAKFAIKDNSKLEGSGIDLVYHWAKMNEVTDVGLLDSRAVIYDILEGMGCQITVYELSPKEQKKLKDDISIISSGLTKIRDTNTLKEANQIHKIYKLNDDEYKILDKQKTKSKSDQLAVKRYKNVQSFGDELMDKPDSQWAIFGDKFVNIHPKLPLEYILRNPDVAKKLDAISTNKSKTEYEGTKYILQSGAFFRYL